MRHAVAPQLIRHDLPRFIVMILQEPLKETPGGRAVTTRLEKHVDHLAVLINGAPQILLLPAYLHENFVDVESIAVPLMPTLQSFGVFWTELVAPQPYRFIARTDTPFSQ